jgi:hypothetical protein
VGTRVAVEVEQGQYVIRWTEGGETHEAARVSAILSEGRVAPPSILEVFAPPDAGYPVVVLGAAVIRDASSDGGVAHGTFHVVITR